MEQKNVTRSENPIARAGAAMSKALDDIGKMATQAMTPKGPTTGQALAQAITQPMGDEPKQAAAAPAAPDKPKTFPFDWPNMRASVIAHTKAELAELDASPFVEADYPKLMIALLMKVATEVSVLNRHLGQPKSKSPKSPIITP